MVIRDRETTRRRNLVYIGSKIVSRLYKCGEYWREQHQWLMIADTKREDTVTTSTPIDRTRILKPRITRHAHVSSDWMPWIAQQLHFMKRCPSAMTMSTERRNASRRSGSYQSTSQRIIYSRSWMHDNHCGRCLPSNVSKVKLYFLLVRTCMKVSGIWTCVVLCSPYL